MATVNKDFKIKSGLIVEGTTATVNGQDILTKKQADQDYIVGLIGGTATSANEPNKVVKRDANGNFAANQVTADLVGDVTGDVTGNVTGNLTGNVTGNVTGDVTGNLTGSVIGTVSSLANLSTENLSERTNLYFTDQRALDATASAIATAAGDVASDLTDHENATEAHGATGAVVGTTNTQTLTNKTIGDTLNFTGAGAMTINSDSHIVLTPAAGSSVKWGADVLATQAYADQAEADAVSTASADATTKANNAKSGAEATAAAALSTAIGTEVADRNSAITSAIGTEVTDRNSAIATAKAQAIADANSYTDAEVAALVDTAPALLDTLNELAAAIADNPNYASDAAAAVAGRVAKSGDTMTGDLTLPGAPTLNLHAATKGYVDQAETDAVTSANSYTDGRETAITTAYQNYANTAESDAVTTANSYTDGEITTALSTAQGYADTAEADANSYTDGEITDALVIAQGYASTAQNNAQTHTTNAINAIDTDDIEEGPTNLYFTNARAIAAVGGTIADQINLIDTDDIEEGTANQYFTDSRAKASALDLLVNATKTNITIDAQPGGGIVITAENGVADSDTDDLVEGTTNKYFTDVRAVDALEAVVPNFTAVELNSVAKQVAATLSAPTAGIQFAHQFLKDEYRSAEYLVKVAYGDHTEISKVLLTLDANDNVAITEYGVVGTNGSASTISAAVQGLFVKLTVTTANNNSTVTVMGTLLK
jgi:hypothetical protein